MSFDEISAIIIHEEDEKKREWEKFRMECFYSIAPFSEVKSAKELFVFPWEETKKVKSNLSHKKVKTIGQKVEKWLNNR